MNQSAQFNVCLICHAALLVKNVKGLYSVNNATLVYDLTISDGIVGPDAKSSICSRKLLQALCPVMPLYFLITTVFSNTACQWRALSKDHPERGEKQQNISLVVGFLI